MGELIFEKFEKIGRLKRTCTITEKIDGTNAQICFNKYGVLLVGSSKREIWPEGTLGKPKGCDNAGFAKWVYENYEALFGFLGEGRHFGEWCGGNIQRGYGLKEKKFALFNTARFGIGKQEIPGALTFAGLTVVPIIYEGEFTTDVVDCAMEDLLVQGSFFAKGFMNPEGVVVYHHAIRKMFKVTYEHDGTGKGKNRQTDKIEEEK
jgi:hypothetical protein